MTVSLRPDSPRREVARRFGTELKRAMLKREIGMLSLAKQCGFAHGSISNYREGRNLPRLDQAIKLAEALQWPRLVEIARMGRVSHCAIDGRPFLNEGGSPKMYCSKSCSDRARGKAGGETRDEGFRILRVETFSRGPARKQQLGKALAFLEEAIKGRAPFDELQPFKQAVDAMCGTCEPDGYCRTEDCPLRAVTTWPLLVDERPVELASRPSGRWGTDELRAAGSDVMRKAWARDPARRERQSKRMTAYFANETPEARAERIRRVSVGRRRKVAAA